MRVNRPAFLPRPLRAISLLKRANIGRWDCLAILLLAALTVFRLFQLSRMELVPDEAYYWDWSRHPALGYYDQGPLIGYVIRLTTTLFGTNEFGVRFGVLAATLGTQICAFLLARRVYSPSVGFLTVAFLGFTPLTELGSIVATYDPLLVFFWAAAVLFLERALFGEHPQEQVRGWVLAGIATGLGFLSKHTMLFLVPCLLLFLVLSPRHRSWLWNPLPYGVFLFTPLFYSGVIWWNAHHHWWTFGHLLFLTAKTSGSPIRRLGDFIGSQAVLIGPMLFLGALLGWVGPARILSSRRAVAPGPGPSLQEIAKPDNVKDLCATRLLFLLCMGLPVFALFCLLTLKSKVQGNWAACAWVTPTIVWAGNLQALTHGAMQAKRKGWLLIAATLATGSLLTAIMMWPGILAGMGVRVPAKWDQSNTGYGWRALSRRVQAERAEMRREGHTKVFLAGNGYQFCALLAFYLPDHPETHDLFLHDRLTMYAAYIDRLKPHLGEDALFVDDGQAEREDLARIFERVDWDPPYLQYRRPLYAEPIRTLYIARCRKFQKFVGLHWARGG